MDSSHVVTESDTFTLGGEPHHTQERPRDCRVYGREEDPRGDESRTSSDGRPQSQNFGSNRHDGCENAWPAAVSGNVGNTSVENERGHAARCPQIDMRQLNRNPVGVASPAPSKAPGCEGIRTGTIYRPGLAEKGRHLPSVGGVPAASHSHATASLNFAQKCVSDSTAHDLHVAPSREGRVAESSPRQHDDAQRDGGINRGTYQQPTRHEPQYQQSRHEEAQHEQRDQRGSQELPQYRRKQQDSLQEAHQPPHRQAHQPLHTQERAVPQEYRDNRELDRRPVHRYENEHPEVVVRNSPRRENSARPPAAPQQTEYRAPHEDSLFHLGPHEESGHEFHDLASSSAYSEERRSTRGVTPNRHSSYSATPAQTRSRPRSLQCGASPRETPQCHFHREPMNYFCFQCSKECVTFCCADCMALGPHLGHDAVKLSHAGTRARDMAIENLTNIRSKMAEAASKYKLVCTREHEASQLCDAATCQIEVRVAELKMRLDEMSSSLSKRCREIFTAFGETNSKEERIFKSEKRRLELEANEWEDVGECLKGDLRNGLEVFSHAYSKSAHKDVPSLKGSDALEELDVQLGALLQQAFALDVRAPEPEPARSDESRLRERVLALEEELLAAQKAERAYATAMDENKALRARVEDLGAEVSRGHADGIAEWKHACMKRGWVFRQSAQDEYVVGPPGHERKVLMEVETNVRGCVGGEKLSMEEYIHRLSGGGTSRENRREEPKAYIYQNETLPDELRGGAKNGVGAVTSYKKGPGTTRRGQGDTCGKGGPGTAVAALRESQGATQWRKSEHKAEGAGREIHGACGDGKDDVSHDSRDMRVPPRGRRSSVHAEIVDHDDSPSPRYSTQDTERDDRLFQCIREVEQLNPQVTYAEHIEARKKKQNEKRGRTGNGDAELRPESTQWRNGYYHKEKLDNDTDTTRSDGSHRGHESASTETREERLEKISTLMDSSDRTPSRARRRDEINSNTNRAGDELRGPMLIARKWDELLDAYPQYGRLLRKINGREGMTYYFGQRALEVTMENGVLCFAVGNDIMPATEFLQEFGGFQMRQGARTS